MRKKQFAIEKDKSKDNNDYIVRLLIMLIESNDFNNENTIKVISALKNRASENEIDQEKIVSMLNKTIKAINEKEVVRSVKIDNTVKTEVNKPKWIKELKQKEYDDKEVVKGLTELKKSIENIEIPEVKIPTSVEVKKPKWYNVGKVVKGATSELLDGIKSIASHSIFKVKFDSRPDVVLTDRKGKPIDFSKLGGMITTTGGSSGVIYNKEMEQVNPATEDKQDDLIARTQDVQNPIPTDGDSVYAKDIDIAGSEIGTFTGNIESLFNDYDVEIIDVSATNPKTFTVKFNRPISTNQVAFGSKAGDLSNVKIQFKDMGGAVRGAIDDSTNNTKYTSQIYPFITPAGVIGKIVFIEMVVEFHTADEVKINGSFIPKLLQQESLIMGYDDSTGLPTYGKFDNGEFIVGGKVGLKDSSNNNIDPATEQKQDEIINTIQGNYIFQYKEDSTDSKILYLGEAEIGSTVSQAVWKIQRWDTTTGAIKLYADGDKEFDNIWDDRETLTYS